MIFEFSSFLSRNDENFSGPRKRNFRTKKLAKKRKNLKRTVNEQSENFSMSSFHLSAEFLSTFTSNEIFSAAFYTKSFSPTTGRGTSAGVEGAIFQIRSIKRLK
jgi:hypothetical protein